jgi:serine/threonine-protein kinase
VRSIVPVQPDPLLPFSAGEVIAGKYRLDSLLGKGGMGMVVRATHVQLLQSVALKFLLPDRVGSPEAAERFLREARAAVRITSEHAGRVVDVGTTDTGVPFIVMEYLDGRDLGAVLKERGPLPVAEVIDYLRQACEALAEAHALGIVHRDLKPQNLFLAERPNGRRVVKVLDFGISKVTDPSISGDDVELTSDAMVMGSPGYMAPEQAVSSKNVDARADIWALGVCLFRLITGQLPFRGGTPFELAAQVLQAPAPDPRALRPDVPADVCAVVARCLEKDPGRRYPTVASLAAALASCAAQASVPDASDVPTNVPLLPAADDAAKTDTAWGNTHVSRRSSGRAVIVGGLVAGGLALGVGVVVVVMLRTARPNVPVTVGPPSTQTASVAPVTVVSSVPEVKATASASVAPTPTQRVAKPVDARPPPRTTSSVVPLGPLPDER